jgi:primosomal protein N' (replication factor Y)
LSLFLPKNLIEKIWKGKLDFEERKYSEIMSFWHVKRVQCKLQSESIKIWKHLNSTAKLAVSPFPLPRGKGLGDGSVYSYTFNFSNTLTQNQEKVYNDIKSSKNNKILLFWVTWSWKTEIYIKLIKDTLEAWKQSLFLIPEIILWNQILDKIKEVFWKDVIIINSTITEAQKTKYFLDILHNQAKIILWTRSALFYPYDNNLWLIIIDEEHDNSYISEKAPRYNAVEVAEKIAEISWKLKAESWKEIKLLLASGTPSINSMYNWVKGKYELINLLEKYR